MVVVSHLFLFLRKSFRGRFDLYESNLPLFGTIYFPTAPYGRFPVYVRTKRMDKLKSGTYVHSDSI